MIRLFASDIDGTILPEDEHITDEILDAIRALKENGIIFMLVSGRDKIALRKIMTRLHTECPAIGLNGAVTFLADGSLATEDPAGLSDEAMDLIYALGKEHNCYYVCHCVTGNYSNLSDADAKENLIEAFMSDRGYDYEKAAAYADEYIAFAYATHSDDNEFIKKQGVLKVEFYFRDPASRQYITDRLQALPETAACSTPYTSIEMTHVSATKGNALDAFIKTLGLTRSEVSVIGDADNDFSMFLPEATKFAMGNAHPFLKEHATHIVADVDHNGFAEAVRIVLESNRSGQ